MKENYMYSLSFLSMRKNAVPFYFQSATTTGQTNHSFIILTGTLVRRLSDSCRGHCKARYMGKVNWKTIEKIRRVGVRHA
jgi:hypothetical protein